jgi:hypothetical protein
MADQPEIHSDLGLKTVAKGVEVTYSLEKYGVSVFPDGKHASTLLWRWMITYHHADDDGRDPKVWTKKSDDRGRSTQNLLFTRRWDTVGRHLVQCVGKERGASEYSAFVQFEQQVEELEAILDSQMSEAKRAKAPNPRIALKTLKKWYRLLKSLGRKQSANMNDAARTAHDKRLAALKSYGEKLEALLDRCGDHIIPFHAVYLAKESMQDTNLCVFLTTPKGRGDTHAMIVDWTNLDEPRLHGEYEGKIDGSTANGFDNAIRAWETDNRYWPVGITYDIAKTMVTKHGTIKTDGKDFTEELTDFLRKIAIGAAFLSLVLFPISSVLAGAMIVTSMVAGATGSVLSIHHRHAHGEGDIFDDAIDVLDIVANALGVGYRAGKAIVWRTGSTLRVRVGKQVVEAMFIGEELADGFNGVLLGTQFVGRYNEIVDAKHLSPEERASAMLDLFRDAAGAAALHGLNNKIASSIEKGDWKKLLQGSDVPEDFTEAPAFPSHTTEGKRQVEVVHRQKRQEPGGVEQPKPTDEQRPAFSKVKKLGLGKKSRRQPEINYIRWSKEQGFSTYGDLSGRGSFSVQIDQAMTTADEIHFNIDGVDVSRASGTLNDFGEPPNGNYTNYELYLLSTRKDFAVKVTWWEGKVAKDKGWWPAELNDPR